MRIDIVSDVVCPWCFIGKRRFERALEMRPEIDIEITWRPFQLNPDMPPEGMPREAYLAAKFGGSHHADRIYSTVREAGAGVGIPFAFDRIRRTPNTRDAHRLIRFATEQGSADTVVDHLFRAYFLEGRDIGDPDTLAAIASTAGLDQDETAAWLNSPAGIEEVIGEDRNARRIGINAVPCFIVDQRYAISGAQEPEFFLPLFDLVLNGAPAEAD